MKTKVIAKKMQALICSVLTVDRLVIKFTEPGKSPIWEEKIDLTTADPMLEVDHQAFTQGERNRQLRDLARQLHTTFKQGERGPDTITIQITMGQLPIELVFDPDVVG